MYATIQKFCGLLLFSLLPITLVASPTQIREISTRDDKFYLASIGDSWAAGYAVKYQDRYDDNNGCLRNKAAWEAQMAGDNSWTDSAIDFKFLACSGAVLDAAAKGDNQNNQPEPQLTGAGTPHLLTMELGGNNCHFAEIARSCIYVGLDGREYPDPESSCYQLMAKWENYIVTREPDQDSFYSDHQKALKQIMDWDTIKGRDDFYFYIVGYAEFFNTSPGSNWCNDKSFGVIRQPKLNNPLRSKINELVRNLNLQVAQSIKDMNNDHIKVLDPSPLFENHRFCEPGHSMTNQYFLNDVWFWNLSPPEDDPDYINILTSPFEAIWEARWIASQVFRNGTKATEEQLLAMLDSPSSNSLGRPFHPKNGGHAAIKDGMIAMLRNDKIPGVKQAVPVQPPAKQPYASGQVHIHINEYWSCLDNDNNLSVQIAMWDNAGTQIGNMKRTQAGAAASAKMGSKLEDQLIVTPEWANGGYIQFQLGGLQFNTYADKDQSKPVYCNVGGYDPREGPACYIPVPEGPPVYNPDAVSIAQMDCYFPAPDWHGGNPSDGSSL